MNYFFTKIKGALETLFLSKNNRLTLSALIALGLLIFQTNVTNAQQNTQHSTLTPELLGVSQGQYEDYSQSGRSFDQGNLILANSSSNSSDPIPGNIYFVDRSVDDTFGYHPEEGPFEPFTTVGSLSEYAFFADDFDDQGNLYAIDFNTLQLCQIDVETGEVTELFFLDVIADLTPTGLSYNPVNGILYGMGGLSGCGFTRFFSVDPITGETQVLAEDNASICGIWLVIDNDGVAYMADIISDALFTVNLVNGEVTEVGDIGLNLNFAQEADVNPATNEIVMAATGLNGENLDYRTIDKNTGQASFLYENPGLLAMSFSNPYPDVQTCEAPIFSFEFEENCADNSYNLILNVSSLGSDGQFSVVNGTETSVISEIGANLIGNFASGSEVELAINTEDPNCSSVFSTNYTNTGQGSTWYADTDSDGFGDPNNSQVSCDQPEGFVLDNTDCDDGEATVFPNAPELCDDLDNNCNGLIDEGDVCVVPGCANMDACNFNPEATEDDGSCFFDQDACELPDGGEGILEDCECVPVFVPVPGCTNDAACNFNPEANEDDDSCFFNDDACELPDGGEGIVEDCECVPVVEPIPGCTNMNACNYNPEANEDDGSCILNGDACELPDGSLGELVDCDCAPVIPSDCETYEYYYADILEDGTTNIYEVSLVGSDAVLELKGTSEIEVHIALNEENGLIYAVSKLDGSFRTFDPDLGTFGPVEMLDTEVSEIVGATFNGDGKLMILSQSENAIYSVTLGANAVSVYDSYSPSLGGDIDFSEDGALYLATREGFGSLYLAIPDEIMDDMYIGTAPQLVTGLADIEGEGSFLLSHRDAYTFMVRAYDGTPGAPYDVVLGGEPFMTFNGDLASGCADGRQPNEPCEQVIYYTNQPPGGGAYTLYSTVLNGDGTATNTALLTDLGSSHIGVTPDGTIVYIVGGGSLHAYDTDLGAIVSTTPLVNEDGAGISGFPACVVADDGTLYIGGNGDNIYSVDPLSGVATLITNAYDVQGGDLVESPDGELWIVTRNNATFTRLSDGLQFSVPGVSINGAAFLENGNVLMADGDNDGDDALVEYNIVSGMVDATYDVEFDVNNGDLAATCITPTEDDEEEESAFAENDEIENSLTSFPNPTNGPSVAIFSTGHTERATLEVYDMNGRLVQELFNGVAELGVEYRIDFDGISLPNGVYMYRLTTNSETTVEKFMIAR